MSIANFKKTPNCDLASTLLFKKEFLNQSDSWKRSCRGCRTRKVKNLFCNKTKSSFDKWREIKAFTFAPFSTNFERTLNLTKLSSSSLIIKEYKNEQHVVAGWWKRIWRKFVPETLIFSSNGGIAKRLKQIRSVSK